MMRGLFENPSALAGLILAQGLCAGVFLWDVVLDGGAMQAFWPIDWHLVVEAGAVLGLIAGIAVEVRVLLRLMARKAHLERQVSMASSALHDVIDDHFRARGLTASEVDVAWFGVKGLSIADIARLRGTAEGTVKSHLNAIYRKAGVANRGELLSVLLEDLMDTPDEPQAPPPIQASRSA